jgi:uncharacterized MAPEG superfamily protein
MRADVYWLVLVIVVTAAMWVPYVLNSFLVRGIWTTLGYEENVPALSPWAARAKRAHYNAVENLVLFGPIMALHAVLTPAAQSAEVATLASVYFFARVVHYVVYLLAIPVARTLAFVTGLAVTVYLGLLLL